jgi:hypothetical protein
MPVPLTPFCHESGAASGVAEIHHERCFPARNFRHKPRWFCDLRLVTYMHMQGRQWNSNKGAVMKRSLPFLVLMAASTVLLAQTSPAPAGGWRRVNEPTPAPASMQPPVQSPGADSQDPTQPVDRSDQYGQPAQSYPQYGQPAQPAQSYPQYGQAAQPAQPKESAPAPAPQPAYGLPARVTLQPGTYVTVRVNDMLSSDRNQVGDPFSAVLAQPLVVDGIVVAQAGQSVYGRVAAVQRQHSSTPSRLGLELTGLTLADGTQAPVRSQLVSRQGGRTPAGAQAATIAGATAVGATIGSVADWGTGALAGGGIGAAAGIIGVLMTRNHPTVVYPETALTFRIESPVTISTTRAPQAFRFVGPEDYNRPMVIQTRPRPPGAYPYPAPAPYYGPYGYPYSYAYPYPYWGPSIMLWGGGYWGGPYWRGGRWGRWR